jgi:hypothetical protein
MNLLPMALALASASEPPADIPNVAVPDAVVVLNDGYYPTVVQDFVVGTVRPNADSNLAVPEDSPHLVDRWWSLQPRSPTVDFAAVFPSDDSMFQALAFLEGRGLVVDEQQILSNSPVFWATAAIDDIESLIDAVPETMVEQTSKVEVSSHAAFTGDEVRRKTLTEFLDYGVDAFGGDTGSLLSSTAPVRIAIIEAQISPEEGTFNRLAADHVGFTESGTSRILAVKDCSNTICTAASTLPTGATHGTRVSWIAAGSIMEGQDPAYPSYLPSTILARRQRSGVARDTKVLYYRLTGGGPALARAIDQAVSDGADVINMSLGFPFSSYNPGNSPFIDHCDANLNKDGLSTAVASAFNAGVVIVESVGNDGHAGACTMGYPSWRPEVVAVASVETDSTKDSYTGSPLSSFSSGGLVPYTLATGVPGSAVGIDLSAPGHISQSFAQGPANYNANSNSGTSYASPIVTANAAMLRDAFASLTPWIYASTRARYIHANLLLSGDHWPGPTGTAPRLQTGGSNFTGLGRLLAHAPNTASDSNSDPVVPWCWVTFEPYIQPGTTFTTGHLSCGTDPVLPLEATQLEVVVEHFTLQKTSMPAYTLRVFDVSRPAGASAISVVDSSSDTVKTVDLRGASNVGGRHFRAEIIYSAGPGSAFLPFVVAFRWHSGTPE